MDLKKRKYNILFLLHMPPPVHGSSVIGGYIKNSRVINESFNCSYLNVLASSSISRTGKISADKLFGFFITFFKLVSRLILKRPDLSYLALTTTGAAFFKDVLLVMVLKTFRVKRVYHLHNKGVMLHQHKFLYRFFYNYVFKDTAVILLSDLLYNDVSSFVEPGKIYICPNGIPNVEKAFKRKGNEGINILFLSNLIESKGVLELVKACASLKQQHIDFRCRFIGGEGDITGKELNAVINKMDLTNWVTYDGKKYGSEKHDAFCSADLFVFPTYYPNECFPLVLLEAMSYGLPVITTKEGGISDIVVDGENGFLVESRNATALAQKLHILLTNPEARLKMGEAGREKYLNEFTLEIFEDTFCSILQKCTD